MQRLAWTRLAAASAAACAVGLSSPLLSSAANTAPVTAPAPALDANNFKAFPLTSVTKLTHDTKRYTFALPKDSDEVGIPVAGLLLVKMTGPDGKPVIRPYTPTSPRTRRGSFDLVVKSYPTGTVSKWLDGLEAGASVEMKGPIVKFNYEPNQWSALGLIAGGSGLTPMLQLIQEIVSNPRDKTEVRLIYANRTPGDIMLKEELDALAAVHPQFKVLYTVDNLSEEEKAAWKGAVGHVTADMITSFLPPPQPEAGKHKILVCGPPGLMKHLSGEKKSPADQGELTGLLSELHYTKDTVYKY